MINPFKEINWNPGESEIRSFGRTLFYGFIIIAVAILAFSMARKGLSMSFTVPLVLIVVGFVVFALTSVVPQICRPLYFAWFFISACIGIVISNVALVIFFYLVFSPYAFMLRIFTGRDPLRLKRGGSKSGWHDYDGRKEQKRYFRQY